MVHIKEVFKMDLFGFLDMIGNYDTRNVANDKVNDAEIDTCAVADGLHPYETGVSHPAYNDGEWIIVEAYDTKEAAETGHKKWVETMSGTLPEKITDCQNSLISRMSNAVIAIKLPEPSTEVKDI